MSFSFLGHIAVRLWVGTVWFRPIHWFSMLQSHLGFPDSHVSIDWHLIIREVETRLGKLKWLPVCEKRAANKPAWEKKCYLLLKSGPTTRSVQNTHNQNSHKSAVFPTIEVDPLGSKGCIPFSPVGFAIYFWNNAFYFEITPFHVCWATLTAKWNLQTPILIRNPFPENRRNWSILPSTETKTDEKQVIWTGYC